eukprot:m.63701 g.63701  ORF g.63701 m.63701 type:complete len:278 (+) comp8173_c0_seq1:35-868(+)
MTWSTEECPKLDGHGPIPADLIATVAAICVVSIALCILSYRKGWMHFYLVTPDMMHGSYVISTTSLGVYRMFVAVYTLGIISWNVHDSLERGGPGWDMRFYTAWNFLTVCILFWLLSLQHVFTYTPWWLSAFTWSLFQVELANCIFLDIVAWSILWPQDPRYDMPFFFFVLNVHALNAVFLLIEVFLGQLRMVPGQTPFVFLYGCLYIICVWINYSETSDCVPYTFLEVSPPDSPAWYVAMVVWLGAVFLAATKIVELKEKCQGDSGRDTSGYMPIQ